MAYLGRVILCCPSALWWGSALLTPALLALLPLGSPQKSGRS